MEKNPDHLNVLRKIHNKPVSTQRELAKGLGFSLGKLNYCLNALKEKGLVKISNFKNNPNKIGYIYVLTPKGINKKAKLTLDFMRRTSLIKCDLSALSEIGPSAIKIAENEGLGAHALSIKIRMNNIKNEK